LTIPKTLPFDQINERCLSGYLRLLEQWFPNGKRRGHEYLVGNLRGDPGESLSINIDTGKWQDFGDITEPKGGDPLSLFAAAFFGGTGKQHRIAACRRLMTELGICSDPEPSKVVPIRPDVVSKARKEDDWVSRKPPADAGQPKVKPGVTRLHVYRDADGQHLRYVARYDRPTKKEFLPYTYGTLNGEPGWHPKHPNEPMCLYGLDRRAANPTARVVIQEGEQKTDLVQDRVPSLVCMAWSGGGHRAKDHDYGPVAGADVMVCGDAVDGEKGMLDAANRCHAAGAAVVWTVDTSGFPKGWDLGNAVLGVMIKHGEEVWKDPDGPWSHEKIETFLRERSRLYEPAAPPPDEPDLGEPNHDQDSDWEKDPAELGSETEGVIPLGHDSGIFYYLSLGSGQVHGLTPSRHVKLELMALASLVGYWRQIPMFEKKGEVDWEKAAAWMMGWCLRIGVFRPERMRGRGAWLDIHRRTGEARRVLHLGESLIVNGIQQRSLRLEGSDFIYAKARGLGQTVAPPLRPDDARKLLEMCELLRWEKASSAPLAAGFVVVSIICGVLRWRPAAWITGGSNSGKTTFLQDIVGAILGRGMDDGIGVNVQSKTTEAGLRQMLGSDARPVLFDEAEAEQLTDKTRMQGNIDLVRQSSSEGGAEIVKGTHNQSGVKRYKIRSCFLFSSINITLDHLADESRITVLDLYNPGPDMAEDDKARWSKLQAIMAVTVADPMWCAGFVARAVLLMLVIIRNAETFKRAIVEEMGSSRVGDQLGTLLAGMWSLEHDHEITLDEARGYLKLKDAEGNLVHDWAFAVALDAPKDEERLTARLLQQRVKLDIGGKFLERTIGELIDLAADKVSETVSLNEEQKLLSDYAATELKRHGIKLEGDGVWISNTHKAIREWLKDTPWSIQWGRSLKRIPGAVSSEPKSIKFGTYDKTKAVWVPLTILEGDD
jgi:putative DNA primase/helicase